MTSRSRRPLRSQLDLVVQLLLTAALGLAMYVVIRVDLVWVIAGILGGLATGTVARLRKRESNPRVGVRQLGQVLIGGALGPAMATQDFGDLGPYAYALFAAAATILAGSLLIGRLYSGWFKVEGVTAGLASMPGGVGIMASVAADLNRPAALVALIQGFRIALVVCAVPLIGTAAGAVGTRQNLTSDLFPVSGLAWALWPCLIVLALIGAWVGKLMKLPVAPLLGPMLVTVAVVLVFRVAGVDVEPFDPPLSQELVGQGLLGITVGEYLARPTGVLRRAVFGGLLSVLATAALGLLIAFGLAAVTPWPLLTCVLVAAPGGAPEMIVLSSATPDYLHVVIAGQLIRQVAVNALMPLWLKIFRSYDTAHEEHAPAEGEPGTAATGEADSSDRNSAERR